MIDRFKTSSHRAIFGSSALLLLALPCHICAADVIFEGLPLPAIPVDVPASTGLNKVYVCYNTAQSSVKFPNNGLSTKWYRYSNLGGGYAEEISSGIAQDNGYSVLQNPESDMGYIVECDGQNYYFWIIGYRDKRFEISSVEAAAEQDCDYSIIAVNGQGEPLEYFTINGQKKTISRDIEVTYNTLTFDQNSKQYIQGQNTVVFEYLSPELRLSPPAYCATSFIVSGDRFMKEWNWLQEKESSVVSPHAVAVYTEAEQDDNNIFSSESTADSGFAENSDDENSGESETENSASNIIRTEESGLGGSAPASISFRAFVTDGVLHNEWQMSANPDFEPIDYRFYQQDLDYTFNEEGTFYLRFIGSNSDGSCEAYSDTYTVTIGASELLCPNAFSPNGDGVNDEWKVAYRSLISFDCVIFDRYGNQITHLKSPDQGWDGKIKGKTAKSGVYYYVITAEGADGKKYKKSGDINIIRHVGNSQSSITE